jgi:excisionase family DNA binding protein
MKNSADSIREWMDLRSATRYVALSERTLRSWIHSVANPLPAVCVGRKILIRRNDLDVWLEAHKIKSFDSKKIGGIVEDIMEGVAAN